MGKELSQCGHTMLACPGTSLFSPQPTGHMFHPRQGHGSMKNKGVVWRNAQHTPKYDGDKIALRNVWQGSHGSVLPAWPMTSSMTTLSDASALVTLQVCSSFGELSAGACLACGALECALSTVDTAATSAGQGPHLPLRSVRHVPCWAAP